MLALHARGIDHVVLHYDTFTAAVLIDLITRLGRSRGQRVGDLNLLVGRRSRVG